MNTRKSSIILIAVLAGCVAVAQDFDDGLKITADQMLADNKTGTLVATGHVHAVHGPFSLLSDLIEKRGDEYLVAGPASLTTCTNDACSLHWQATGEMHYHGELGNRSVTVKDVTLRLFDVPVFWLPYYYYPLDTDYGWRVMPGYTKRWGGYLLTKYVYGIAGGFEPGQFGLSGATRLDLRTENGVALGQSLNWQLGDFGRGKFKVYYAWDDDADRYSNHWTDQNRYHFENWSNHVPDERYAVELFHRWDATERDVVRFRGFVTSDIYFRSDFLRDGLFGMSNRFIGYDGNELAWEHLENSFGLGVSVSGPLNYFYSGVSRLPELYFDVAPQPVFSLPINYESQSRIGFLNRDYARLGRSTTAAEFRYVPGEWADYQTFRFDTYHRLTLPFKVADVLSVVPRVGARATFWDQTGYENLNGYGRANKAQDAWRAIIEAGVTFAARGVGDIGKGWQHVFEPYADVLAQEADYSGLKRGARPYMFDSIDGSSDWLDQFAGRSRNLPYSWYGVTPGIRNAFRKSDDKGHFRTVFDIDIYAAVQLNDTEWTAGNRYHRLSKDPADPNYGDGSETVVPGVRARLFASDDIALMARIEYDVENSTLAYADVSWSQKLSKDLNYKVTYSGRDHRRWDFASSPYNPATMRNEDFNWANFSMLEFRVEHDVTDWLAWSPFIRIDCREGDLDEVGSWIDLRTDCLGFRFSLSYENSFRSIDYSEYDDDWRFGFFIYLRAFGASNGSPF